MILIIHGDDSFQIRDQLALSIDYYKNTFGSRAEVVFIDSLPSEDDIKNIASQSSLFEKRKIIVANGLLSSKQDLSNTILRFFSKSDNLIIIIEEQEVNSKKLANFLEDGTEIKKYQKLEQNNLKDWIRKRISNNGGSIDGQALNQLINFVGNDLWELSNEIDKLVLYKNNEVIEIKDVNLLVTSKVEGDIFRMVEYISKQKTSDAFKLTYKHLEKGDSVYYLLSMINFQFRNLVLAKMSRKDMSGAKELSMHPYVFQKILDQIMIFSESDLKKIYRRILRVDIDIKTGKMTPEIALDLLIAEIG